MSDKRRWDYKICPICGASLDVGEECDCTQKKLAPELTQERIKRGGQYKTIARPKKRLQGVLRG